jgi:hypothetical protein
MDSPTAQKSFPVRARHSSGSLCIVGAAAHYRVRPRAPRDLGKHVGGVRRREVAGGRGDEAVRKVVCFLFLGTKFQWVGNQVRLPPQQLSYCSIFCAATSMWTGSRHVVRARLAGGKKFPSQSGEAPQDYSTRCIWPMYDQPLARAALSRAHGSSAWRFFAFDEKPEHEEAEPFLSFGR